MGARSVAANREAMVEYQLRRRGITEPDILEAFRSVPRELFIASDLIDDAYADHPLPIEAGQTISQPYIVALMIQAAGIRPGYKILEVGSGSGYAAAVISRIAARVIGIERQQALVEAARQRVRTLGHANVQIVEGDGSRGWPREAPYDSILVAAAGSHVPTALVEQLVIGGRLVMPLGEPGAVQKLVRVERTKDNLLQQSDLGDVRFVPLIGKEGWSDA